MDEILQAIANAMGKRTSDAYPNPDMLIDPNVMLREDDPRRQYIGDAANLEGNIPVPRTRPAKANAGVSKSSYDNQRAERAAETEVENAVEGKGQKYVKGGADESDANKTQQFDRAAYRRDMDAARKGDNPLTPYRLQRYDDLYSGTETRRAKNDAAAAAAASDRDFHDLQVEANEAALPVDESDEYGGEGLRQEMSQRTQRPDPGPPSDADLITQNYPDEYDNVGRMPRSRNTVGAGAAPLPNTDSTEIAQSILNRLGPSPGPQPIEQTGLPGVNATPMNTPPTGGGLPPVAPAPAVPPPSGAGLLNTLGTALQGGPAGAQAGNDLLARLRSLVGSAADKVIPR